MRIDKGLELGLLRAALPYNNLTRARGGAMSEPSNSRSLQRVYEITVFDGTFEPACLIIIHFTQVSRQLMTKRGQDVLLAARKIAKRLAFPLDQPVRAGMKVRDTFLDIDLLGPPADYPDNSGSRAWVSDDENALPGSSQ